MKIFRNFIYIFILGGFLLPGITFARQNAVSVLGQASSYTTGIYNGFLEGSRVVQAPQGGAVVDTVGHRLFVPDTSANRVLIFNLDSSNTLVDHYADNVIGQDSLNTIRFGKGKTGFLSTTSLDYDSVNKRLFVADFSGNRVLVFDLSSGITNGMEASYVLGQPDFVTRTAGTTASKLNGPQQVSYSLNNKYLYVADYTNRRVLVFNLSNGITSGMDATYVIGQADFTSSTNSVTQTGATNPIGVKVDDSHHRLFVSDASARRVLTYDTNALVNGMSALNVIGQATFTASSAALTAAGMSQPRHIEYDSTNNRLFVPDLSYNRVLIFDVSTITDGMSASYELGQTAGGSAFTTSTAAATAAGMSQPTGVGYDAGNNRLFVTQFAQNRVTVYDLASLANGMSATNLIGQIDSSGNPVYTTTTALSSSTTVSQLGISQPEGLTLDLVHHRLFVSDASNARVLVYNLSSSNELTDTTPDNVLGQPDFVTNSTACSSTKLSNPRTVIYDPVNDRLFVADRNRRRVMIYDTASITDGEAAVNVLGQGANGATTGGNAFTTCTNLRYQDNIFDAWGLAYDTARQYLFVGDSSMRLMVWDLSGGITNNMNASYILGKTNFTDSTAYGTTQNSFGGIPRLAYDQTHKYLFVADEGINRVVVFDTTTISNNMNASYVLGQSDYTSSTAGTSASKFDFIAGMYYDTTTSQLFVNEHYNSRVLVFDMSSGITNNMSASMVIGQNSFTEANPHTTQDGLGNLGFGVYYDPTLGMLYVSDYSNNRIMTFSLISISTTSLANGKISRPYSATISNSGTSSTYEYTLVSGTLPNGLTVSSTGVSGTPTQIGTFTFTVKGQTFLSSISSNITLTIDPLSSSNVSHSIPTFVGGGSSVVSSSEPTYKPSVGQSTASFVEGKNITGYAIAKSKDFTDVTGITPFKFTDENPKLELPRKSYDQYVKFYSSTGDTTEIMMIPAIKSIKKPLDKKESLKIKSKKLKKTTKVS